MRARRVLLSFGIIGLAAIVVACNAILGNEPRKEWYGAEDSGAEESGRGGDASDVDDAWHLDGASTDGTIADSEGGAPDDAGADVPETEPGDGCASSACGCPTRIVYVSNAGDDANAGTASSAPKKTIAEALAYLRALAHPEAGSAVDLRGTEVHVCAGGYVETGLTLDIPVSLLGGYDCAMWTRPSDYAYPTFTNRTTITNGNFAVQGEALLVQGGGIDACVVVDGLTIGDPSAAGSMAAAVRVEGASPTISNDDIRGGAFDAGAIPNIIASTGLRVGASAAPTISHDRIHGGSGVTTGGGSGGSVGIWVASSHQGALSISDNEIIPGVGSPSNIGIQVNENGTPLVAVHAIQRNQFTFGTSPAATISAIFSETQIDFVDNTIDGGSPTANGNSRCVWLAKGSDGSRIARNRIYAGARSNTSSVLGIFVQASVGSILVDNMVHGGSAESSEAIYLGADAIGTQVAFNTLLGGVSTVPQAQLDIANPTTPVNAMNTSVFGNLFVAIGSHSSFAIGTRTCPQTSNPFARVEGNAFVNGGTGLMACGANHGQPIYASVEEMESALHAVNNSSASRNITVRTACGDAGASCVPLAGCDGVGTSSCMTSLFGSWNLAPGGVDPGASGISDLFDTTTGWRLGPSVPCAIAQHTVADPLRIADVDIFGTTRTPDPSIGAHESDVCKH